MWFSGVDQGIVERGFHLDKLLCSVQAVNKSQDGDRESSGLRINISRCLISSGLFSSARSHEMESDEELWIHIWAEEKGVVDMQVQEQ